MMMMMTEMASTRLFVFTPTPPIYPLYPSHEVRTHFPFGSIATHARDTHTTHITEPPHLFRVELLAPLSASFVRVGATSCWSRVRYREYLRIVAPPIYVHIPGVHIPFAQFNFSRYSSFEAYVVGGEVLDGETGWTSPSVSSASNNGGGGGGGLPHQHQSGNNNHLESCNSSAAGSALRPGGRANFFFGADYAALNKARADQAAARLPTGRVDPKAAAVLGVAGSADTGSRGGVASKAQKLLGVGRKEGEEGRGEVLALQDESVSFSVCFVL